MIEINCDLGEGIPNEADVYPFIDAASIACGGHFGDYSSIKESLSLAKEAGVKVGAHPSYPDQKNFGRKSMQIEIGELLKSLTEQIDLFLKVADELEMSMDHIKFHGALYNDAAANESLAKALMDFVSKEYPRTCIFVPPHSQTEKLAILNHIPHRVEIFGDRSYRSDYSLVPRKEKNALLTKVSDIEAHLSTILEKSEINLQSGEKIKVKADTLCFHGDNPGLPDFLSLIRSKFWK
ncbi:LamB/YcsF family protein [Algoriphagus namhaensis]|uniref:LamB/YcsF family protein n=1 Tax=Algoriphagus namhaensis TaxID=915353 RepID=A0ABV8AWM7_9BACT